MKRKSSFLKPALMLLQVSDGGDVTVIGGGSGQSGINPWYGVVDGEVVWFGDEVDEDICLFDYCEWEEFCFPYDAPSVIRAREIGLAAYGDEQDEVFETWDDLLDSCIGEASGF